MSLIHKIIKLLFGTLIIICFFNYFNGNSKTQSSIKLDQDN